ncbi:chemotaxis protein CheW [Natronorubrum daqingense]|uniref:Chemotaxis protein CheW n=1 Tax=Natronorubrum daqingense TaxID=588898 RepID=A0A1N6Z543_9EURY|nr:chemotaxis protein CheW [Natronorubrum daqingense]APX95460.1 chemotaxis protein CheW [Natronorubrum daqingense]SIR21861.1 purine-binding chemotaxis protein CheW [Natronorubrum daqingense]
MPSSPPPDDTNERVTVLTFTLADDRYCVNADTVASVFGISDDEALADASDPWNAGSVTVDGTHVQVVDLPRAFSSAARTTSRVDEPKLIVFAPSDDTERTHGWLVDEVDVTKRVQPAALEATQTGTGLAHVKGRVEIDGEDAIWLDERAIHG